VLAHSLFKARKSSFNLVFDQLVLHSCRRECKNIQYAYVLDSFQDIPISAVQENVGGHLSGDQSGQMV
jgi:hypothetical protein